MSNIMPLDIVYGLQYVGNGYFLPGVRLDEELVVIKAAYLKSLKEEIRKLTDLLESHDRNNA